MKKNFTKKLMAAAILLLTAVSPSWADYTITKSNGEPAVSGTDYIIEDDYIDLKTDGLVLSGEFNLAVFPYISNYDAKNYTLTLKDVIITSDFWAGALAYQNESLNIVLEGTNRLVSTGDGPAIILYNGASEITFTGSGELYMTSQAIDLNVAQSCLYIDLGLSRTGSATAEGFTIKGSLTYNADVNTLTDAVIDEYQFSDGYMNLKAVGFLIGEDRCNTVWMGHPAPAFDPDTEYVVVTYKEGGETKKAYYKALDVEKIEWLKGEDITE